jgi:hypothetical protein
LFQELGIGKHLRRRPSWTDDVWMMYRIQHGHLSHNQNREMWITFDDDGWYLRDDSSSFIHPDVKMSAVTTLLSDTVTF